MGKKYKLTDESINVPRGTLYRIKALRSFSDVKSGDLGGFIASEKNLSHVDNCWVYEEACVYEEAKIFDNVRVSGSSHVFGNAYMSGKVNVSGTARIWGNVHIFNNVTICGDTYIGGSNFIYINGETTIDHGVWTQWILLNDDWYLISSTLEKLLLEW